MKNQVLAERYAKALIDLGLEEKALERYQEELQRFAGSASIEPRLLPILSAKEIELKKREQILEDLMLKFLLFPQLKNFLRLLFKKGRIQLLPLIAKSFESMVRKLENVMVAQVKFAHIQATKHLSDNVKRSLETLTGKKIELELIEDPSLIGGLQVILGDTIYDASIQGELQRIREEWI